MTPDTFRPRTGPELVDSAFQLFKVHFVSVITIAAIACLPALIIRLVLPTKTPAPGNPLAAWHGHYLFATLINLIAGTISSALIQGALITVFSEAYQGRTVAVGPALSAGASKIIRIWLVTTAALVLASLALMFFIIPGVILWTWWFVVPAIVVLEQRPLSWGIFARSRFLCQDHKLRIFGFGCIYIVFLIVSMVTLKLITSSMHSTAFAMVFMIPSYGVVLPLFSALMVVQYYDARIRKEGYDVELMAGALTTPPSTIS